MKKKIRVLFIQSQHQPLPFASINSLLMRYYDRERVEVYAACPTVINGEKTSQFRILENIADLHLRSVNFGPTIAHGSKAVVARNMICAGSAATISMVGLISYIRQRHIDIVHVSEKSRDAFCSVLVATLAGIKSVVHLHSKCGSWMSSPARWAMKHADGIIGVSQYGAQCAIDQGYRPEKIYHVFNSIDISRWNYETDGNPIRREFGIGQEIPLLAIISRVVPSKGHELLLKALSEIKNKIPDFRLLIVGEDDLNVQPKGSRSYIEYLREKTRELALERHVIFTGFRSDIQLILAACDLYTMPAIDEPFGLVFAEAMAMKMAVIALDQGGTPEIVEHGKTGLLSPQDDVQQLAEHILTLIKNPKLRNQMGEYGRKRAEQYFNPQRMADNVEQIYRLILGYSAEQQHQHITVIESLHQR